LIINALFNALYFRNERAEQLCLSTDRQTKSNLQGNTVAKYTKLLMLEDIVRILHH